MKVGNKKIDISHNGKTLYFGGDGGLVILKRQNSMMPFNLQRNEPQLKYYGLRPTPSGHIVMQMKGSNDLVVYTKNISKEVHLSGERVDSIDNGLPKDPHFSFEGEKLIWFGGLTSLYTIDLRTLEREKISNFIYDMGNRPPEPICAIADFKRNKHLVVYDMDGDTCVVYHEEGREPDPHLLDDIFPKYKKITCADLNEKKIYGFVGGTAPSSDNAFGSMNQTVGCLSAFNFNKELSLIAEIEFDKRQCSRVTKVICSKGQEDVVFVSSDGPLFIVGINAQNKVFEVLKAIEIPGGSKPTIL